MSKEWVHIGGDLEACHDAGRYVNIRVKRDEDKSIFISKEALFNALSLFPDSYRIGDKVVYFLREIKSCNQPEVEFPGTIVGVQLTYDVKEDEDGTIDNNIESRNLRKVK